MGLSGEMFFIILGILFSCFFLHECEKLAGYKFPVYATEVCPRNQTEWNLRSSSINCNESNGYMCLPNENITELLEFCYIFPFIWIEEDICLYLYKRVSKLNSYNCSSFRFGCPNSTFPSYEMYNYPSCTSIRNGCFIAEQSCESTTATDLQESTKYTPIEEKNINKLIYLVAIVLGVMIPIIVFCMLYISFKRGPNLHPKFKFNEFYEEAPFFEEKQLEKSETVDSGLQSRPKSDEFREEEPFSEENQLEEVETVDPGLRTRPKIDEIHEKEQFSEQKQLEEAETVDPDNRLEAQMKTEFTTSSGVEKSKIEALNEYLLFILKNPNTSWTSETLIEIVKDNIHNTVDNGREDLLKKFYDEIQNDNETKKTLSQCGIEMYWALKRTKEKCKATQVEVTKGCLCFTFCFATDSDLEHYLNILRNEDKDFKRNISEVILDKQLMNVFEVDSKRVSWDITEVTVIKESTLYLEEQVLEPANGFAVNFAKSKGKKTKVDLPNVAKTIQNSKKLVVVVIDFGTLFSGCAFSLTCNWRKKFYCMWQTGYHTTRKTTTCLLLKKDFSESFFGYEAEDKFTEMASEDRLHNYFYFQHFGIILHKDLTEQRDILLYDWTGKSLEASVVFAHSIIYLKKWIYKEIEKAIFDIENKDIEYVFTVPETKDDKATLLIREAAIKAGIKLRNLTMVLEPEAVSMYCQYLKFTKEDASLDILKAGTNYIVVDLGGSLSEITLHQICEDNNFRAVLPTMRRQLGGKSVDDAFFKFLSELVGEDVWQEFKMNHIKEVLDIARVFEAKKRTVNTVKCNEKIRLRITQVLIDLCTTFHGVDSFKEIIKKNNHVNYRSDKLDMDHSFFCGFFKETINGIIEMVDEYLQTFEAKDVKCIIIVGGFSQCLLLKEEIKKHFRNVFTIIPENSDVAVLNGAITFAMHAPNVCSAKFT